MFGLKDTDMVNIPLFIYIVLAPSQVVVWDVFQQEYVSSDAFFAFWEESDSEIFSLPDFGKGHWG